MGELAFEWDFEVEDTTKLLVELARADGAPGPNRVYTLGFADEAAIRAASAKDLRGRIARECGLTVSPTRLRLLHATEEVRSAAAATRARSSASLPSAERGPPSPSGAPRRSRVAPAL